jgi:hypothetical protein
MLLGSQTHFKTPYFQNVMGIWINTHAAFVVNEKDPEAYLDLIRTPAKTIIQTGQVGAILLADALMVRLLSVHSRHKPQSSANQRSTAHFSCGITIYMLSLYLS